MSEFSGKVAIVTGSSSGIGEAIARRLAGLGASVVINSASSVAAGQQIAKDLGDNTIYVQADCVEATLGLLRNRYATGQIFVVDGGLKLVM